MTAHRRALRSVAVVQYEGGERFAGVLLDRRRRLVLTTAEAVAREKTALVTFAVEQDGGPVVEAAWYKSQRDLLRRKGAASAGVVLAVVDPAQVMAARAKVPSLSHGRRFEVVGPGHTAAHLHVVRGPA